MSPELVQVSTASTKWQAPFEAPLTDVFGVQADVAARVAEALGLALGSAQREQLAERPTQNLAAYDAYLRALDLRRTDAPAAAAELERAIALDSAFALAWAELALTRQYFHSVGFTPQEQIERSRREAERALAMQPKQPLAHYALGEYYARRLEYDRALAEYARGLAVTPNDARLLEGVVRMDLRRGQWERALEGARRVEPLDPRSTEPLFDAAMALTRLRRFPEALAVVDRALVLDSLSPGWYPARLDILGAQGDLAGVRWTVDLAERRLGLFTGGRVPGEVPHPPVDAARYRPGLPATRAAERDGRRHHRLGVHARPGGPLPGAGLQGPSLRRHRRAPPAGTSGGAPGG